MSQVPTVKKTTKYPDNRARLCIVILGGERSNRNPPLSEPTVFEAAPVRLSGSLSMAEAEGLEPPNALAPAAFKAVSSSSRIAS